MRPATLARYVATRRARLEGLSPYSVHLSFALKAIRGALWTVGTGVAARFIGVVGTLVITRFLAPEVVGEVGVAVILVFTASQLSNIGFGQYVVAKPQARRETVFHATVFNLVTAALAMVVAVAIAEPLAPHFGAPDMAQYVPGLALAVFFQRASLIPERIVVRDMRFRVFAVGTALPELVYTGVSVGLAASGWGGQAIVIGNVCQLSFRWLFFVVAVKWRDWLQPTGYDRDSSRDIFRFGVPIWIGNLASFMAERWEKIIIARLFGPGVMGAYNLALNLAQIPADYIGVAIADVLMPSFAHMKAGHARVAVVRSIRLLAIVVFPMAVGLGAVSETLVATLFNQEWQGIAPFLMVLAFPAIAGPIGDAIQVYLKARDMPRAVMVVNVITAAALLGMVYGLGQLGPLWAALGVGAAGWLWAGMSLWIIHRYDQVSAWPAVRGLIGPVLSCAVMTGAVFGVRYLLSGADVLMPLLLAVEIATGAVAYVAAAFVFAGSTARELLGLFRDAVRKRRGG